MGLLFLVLIFNLKFTLLLILVFADFKVDHLHLFRKSIADYLAINLKYLDKYENKALFY
jgi:hypothetical protein